MGLAPYGEPRYVDQIKDNLIDIKDLNGKLIKEKIFDDIWKPAGDAGSALGAALVGWHQHHGQERTVNGNDSMKSLMEFGPRH